ncbi:MAG: EpsG family protein [Clostridia bacterium]|nr:EpsG family protein [Clostridia bacterium]
MIPYILLIVIPVAFQFIAVKKNGRNILVVGNDAYINKNNFALPVFFLIFLLLLVLRDESIGRDLGNYKSIFNYLSSQSLSGAMKYGLEPLYKLLNWGIGQLTSSYQWFLGIVASMYVIPVAQLYCGDRRHGVLKIVLFVNLSTFIMMFSGLRQAIAMAIGMIAYRFVREKKLAAFIVTVLIAIGFHQSAIILVIMYPLYHITLRKIHLLFVVPGMIAIFVLNRPIFAFLVRIMGEYSDKYEGATATSTGAFGSLILFVLYAIFVYVIPDEKQMNREVSGLRNIMLLIVCIQCFAPLHNLAMRMNYYFLLFIPILIGKVLDIPSQRYRKVAQFAEVVLIVFFSFIFVRSTYISSVTGISMLDTVPYKPFWR